MDILESFGGHEMAAGLTIPEENIAVFRERLRAFTGKKIAGMPEPALSVDFEVLKPGLLTEENVASFIPARTVRKRQPHAGFVHGKRRG